MKGTNPITIGVIVLVAGVFLWYVVGSSEKGPTVSKTESRRGKTEKRPSSDRYAEGEFSLTLRQAKSLVKKRVYHDHFVTLFCQCPFDPSQTLSTGDCGYRPGEQSEGGERARWRRLVPVNKRASRMKCWKKGHPDCLDEEGRKFTGRQCCSLPGVSEKFRRMNADLHNIVPVIGELHESSFHLFPGEVEGENRSFGACDFEIDREKEVYEPAESVRGDVARIFLYMNETYGVKIEEKNRALLLKWHREDPPDDWEEERNERIKEIQENGNPFVENPEQDAETK